MAFNCNGCWSGCQPGEMSVVTSCNHLLCVSCAQTIIESDDSSCPICNQVMTKNNVKAVTIQAGEEAFKLTLAGQTPEVALKAAKAAIEFFHNQQLLYSQLQQQQMQRKIDKTQEQCRKKLTEVHNGYTQAKRKYQDLSQQMKVMQEDNRELQEKYNQKAHQDKKLKEALALLQQENDNLRRNYEQLAQRVPGGGSGAGGGGMPINMGFGGGGGLGGGGRPGSRMANFGDENLELGGGRAKRASLGGGGAARRASLGGARAVLPEVSPLQSPNFNPHFNFETPANQPVMRNVLNSTQFLPNGNKPLGGMNLGNRRNSLGLNTNSPSGMASL